MGGVLSAFLKVAFDRLPSREVLDFLKGRKPIDGLVLKLKIELISADAVLLDVQDIRKLRRKDQRIRRKRRKDQRTRRKKRRS